LADPCKSYLVKTIRESSIRSVGRCVVKKEPITPEILRQLVNVYGFHNTEVSEAGNVRVMLKDKQNLQKRLNAFLY
jgi:hypothetical protein